MDAAAAARMSDPDNNPMFKRRWRDAAAPRHAPEALRTEDIIDGLDATAGAIVENWRRGRFLRDGGER